MVRSIDETTEMCFAMFNSWTILVPVIIFPKLPEPHLFGLSIFLFLFELVYTELFEIKIFDV